MRKTLLIALLTLLPVILFSQKLSNGIYWISLTDKAGNGYSLNAPQNFLSQRAIERRARQNISLSPEDLPLSKIYSDSLENLGLKILGCSKWFNSVIIESYDTLLLDTLDRISFVSEFQYKIPRKKNIQIKSGPGLLKQGPESLEGGSFDYGLSYPQIAMLRGNELHQLGFRGDNMQIAVIDGGFFMADKFAAFDSLWNEGRVLGTRDFSHSNTAFFNTASHGMSVLSTMAANIPGEIIGTAPKASYWLLKSEIVETETPVEEAYWVLAAEFADSTGADIITSSLGYSRFDDPSMDYTYSDMDGKTALVTRAAEKAFSKGMVVVISAGNEGNKSWKYISAPADGTNVLSIGAIDTSGYVVAFSSRGPSSDDRVKPDILAVGYKAIVINSSGNLSMGSGTSFSAPQVAGMVACLWQASPEKSNSEVVQAIRRSSSLYFSPNDSAGYGIPDFLNALFILKSSIRDIPAERLFVVPNPSIGIFELRSDSIPWSDLKVSIYNISGKKIYSGIKPFSAGFTRINEMEGQESGIYFIIAESGEKKYFTHIIHLKQ